MKKFAVIVAGGSGKRFGSETPKQFLEINGLPIIFHTIRKFHVFGCEIKVVIPESHQEEWNLLLKKHEISIPIEVVFGGKERFHSVQNGINTIREDGVVAVHDSVRPLVSKEMLEEGFDMAIGLSSAIPVVEVRDSMRQMQNESLNRVDRNEFKLIQTPQIFDVKELQKVMDCEYNESFTDEATLWESKGNKLFYYEGDHQNLKITFPADLKYAEAVLSS